jgi:hypothetical protein
MMIMATEIASPIERATKGVKIIDSDHGYIHDGDFYEAFFNETIATGASVLITITTPDDLYVHYRNEKINTSGDKIKVELFEDATIASGGTAFTPINHNRVTTKISKVSVVRAPTLVTGADGSLIAQTFIGGGTGLGGNRNGAETVQTNEYILKQSCTYVVKITNDSAASNVVQLNPTWYEEEGY